MAKLYFKYGAMGSSKSAQALITQFNYEERGMTVWLIKPSIDDRDGANVVKSRVGLFREADVIAPEDDLLSRYQVAGHKDVIIADEAQFLTPQQIDQLRQIVDEADIPVLCFGLRTDFLTHLFPGSHGAGGFYHGDQDHLLLRSQGHSQRPVRSPRERPHPGKPGLPGR